jgi:tRNA pseudouridine38-40 synthase
LVEYDGTDFAGFQRQPGRRTVQGELERCLGHLTSERVALVAAGRTDAGVHATGQVVSFHSAGRIPTGNIPAAANSLLPKDIAVRGAEEASEQFHARYSARSRVYRYTVVECSTRSALLGRYALVVREPLAVRAMEQAGRLFTGVHDFRGYSLSGAQNTTVRELKRLEVKSCGQAVEITIEANAFLRGMARFIVAALLHAAAGRLMPEELSSILETGERPAVLGPAPPQGLCLVQVIY